MKSINNNLYNNEGEIQDSGNQECKSLQQKLSGGPTVGLRLSNDVESLDYWKNLEAELMKIIPLYLQKTLLNLIS